MTEFGTPDIFLAAAYIALGAVYTRADKTNPKHMVFYFSYPEDESEEEPTFSFASIEQRWVNNSLLVNATRYKDALQRLKSVVHSR